MHDTIKSEIECVQDSSRFARGMSKGKREVLHTVTLSRSESELEAIEREGYGSEEDYRFRIEEEPHKSKFIK